jgi:hypothetical protein
VADDDDSIDRAVTEATAVALRKLRAANLDVDAARDAFEHGVGVASWGSLGFKLERRARYRRPFADLVTALEAVGKAIAAAEDECRKLRRIADQ